MPQMLLSTDLTIVVNEMTQEEKCCFDDTVRYFGDECPSLKQK